MPKQSVLQRDPDGKVSYLQLPINGWQITWDQTIGRFNVYPGTIQFPERRSYRLLHSAREFASIHDAKTGKQTVRVLRGKVKTGKEPQS